MWDILCHGLSSAINNEVLAEWISLYGLHPYNYFILYSETQCISKLDKIGIFIDMKFH